MMSSEHQRAFGVFSSPEPIEEALQELQSSGFPMDKISVLAKDVESGQHESGVSIQKQVGNQTVDAPDAATKVSSNTAWGSLLVGLSSLAIPGIGPVIAAGSVGVALVAAVTGMGAAAVSTRNLAKGLANLGVPQPQAELYSDRLQSRNYLLMLEGTNDEINRAEGIFSQRGIQDWGVYAM